MKNNLKKKIEEKIGAIKAIDLLTEQGSTSNVYKIETFHESFLLKSTSDERYRMWLSEEAQVLKKVCQINNIPSPHFYGFIEEADSSNLIMSFEKGMTLTTALREAASFNQMKSLVESFGQFLHNFHEKAPCDVLKQEEYWLERQLVKAQNYVNSKQTDGDQKLLNQLKQMRPFSVKQTMIHGDCTTDNVLVTDREVKLFIDLAGMTVGDYRYDISLAISKFINNPELLDAFYAGYTRYRVSKSEFQYFNEGLYEFF